MPSIPEYLDRDIFTIAQLLSPEECAALISRGESLGFEAASVTTGSGPKMLTGIRNNDRVDLLDDDLLQTLWGKVSAVMPREMDGFPIVGLHPRLRFYRYDPGQRFKRHRDGRVYTEAGEVSRLTLMIYLNEGASGGETIFTNYDLTGPVSQLRTIVVTPSLGMGLCFLHELWHEGAEIVSGRKYVLRADVLFKGEPS